jgi:hypothetical protein
MYRRTPLGICDVGPPVDGTTPYAGSNVPGLLGMARDEEYGRSPEQTRAGVVAAGLDGSVSAPFAVGADFYRLYRLDTDWRQRPNEIAVPPEDATAIVERALAQHHHGTPLARLLQTAVSRLAGPADNRAFILVWLRPQSQTQSGGMTPSPVPTPRAPILPPQDSPAPVEEVMAVAQAAVLKKAAADGVPFCEECARLAAERAA